MIVGEIRRYLRDNSSLRVSRSMRDTAYRVLQAKEKFMNEHQREPSMEEIAKMLELKREDVVFALDAIVDPVSLYEPVYEHGGDTICVMEPGEGLQKHRRELAGAHCPEGGHGAAHRPGEADSANALF